MDENNIKICLRKKESKKDFFRKFDILDIGMDVARAAEKINLYVTRKERVVVKEEECALFFEKDALTHFYEQIKLVDSEMETDEIFDPA